jgi:hypothetical protein
LLSACIAWRRVGIYTQDYRRAIEVIGVHREEFRKPFSFVFTFILYYVYKYTNGNDGLKLVVNRVDG